MSGSLLESISYYGEKIMIFLVFCGVVSFRFMSVITVIIIVLKRDVEQIKFVKVFFHVNGHVLFWSVICTIVVGFVYSCVLLVSGVFS